MRKESVITFQRVLSTPNIQKLIPGCIFQKKKKNSNCKAAVEIDPTYYPTSQASGSQNLYLNQPVQTLLTKMQFVIHEVIIFQLLPVIAIPSFL